MCIVELTDTSNYGAVMWICSQFLQD